MDDILPFVQELLNRKPLDFKYPQIFEAICFDISVSIKNHNAQDITETRVLKNFGNNISRLFEGMKVERPSDEEIFLACSRSLDIIYEYSKEAERLYDIDNRESWDILDNAIYGIHLAKISIRWITNWCNNNPIQ